MFNSHNIGYRIFKDAEFICTFRNINAPICIFLGYNYQFYSPSFNSASSLFIIVNDWIGLLFEVINYILYLSTQLQLSSSLLMTGLIRFLYAEVSYTASFNSASMMTGVIQFLYAGVFMRLKLQWSDALLVIPSTISNFPETTAEADIWISIKLRKYMREPQLVKKT